MANRYPIILDTTDGNRLKEIPSGDGLDLTGNTIVGVGNISSTGNITNSGDITSGGTATAVEVSAGVYTYTGGDAFPGDGNLLDQIDWNRLNNKPTLSGIATGGGNFFELADVPPSYAGFAGQFIRVNDAEDGLVFEAVSSGGITGADVITALGYTPYDNANPSGFISGITGTNVTDALGYTPYDSSNPSGYLSSITSVNVIDALGYTPYDGTTNALGFLTGITGADVTDALGYTPYDNTNPLGFIAGASGITDALGYTPYDGVTNSAGFLTSISSTNVTDALGYTPYNAANPSNYINDSAGISLALGYTPYDGVTNSAGFITAESQTLDDVVTNGATTTGTITAAGFTTAGNINALNVSISGDLTLTSTGTISLDGGTGSTVVVGGTSNTSLRDASGNIDIQAGLIPNSSGSYNIGSNAARFGEGHFNSAVTAGDFATNTASATFTLSGSMDITPGSATSALRVTAGVFGVPSITTTQRNALTPSYGDIIHNTTTGAMQGYQRIQNIAGTAGWVDLVPTWYTSAPSGPYEGMLALADGSGWDPKGDGSRCLVCYLNAGWVIVAFP